MNDEQLEMMKKIYEFTTGMWKPDGDKYTRAYESRYPAYWEKRLYEKGYILNTCWHRQTRALILDIDCHNGEEAAEKAYKDAVALLEDNEVHYCSGISSEDDEGNPRGYHIYVVFNEAQNQTELYEVAVGLKGNLGYDHIDLYPCSSGIRLWWIPKPNGKVGRTLHWDNELNTIETTHDLWQFFYSMSCEKLQSTNVFSKYTSSIVEDSCNEDYCSQRNSQQPEEGNNSCISRITPESYTPYDWHMWTVTRPSGLSMEALFNAAKSQAKELGYGYHPFSYSMVKDYFNLEVGNAKMKLYRWRKRHKVKPERPSKNDKMCHLYSTRVDHLSKSPRRTSIIAPDAPEAFHEGRRNDELLAFVRANGWRSDDEIVEQSVQLFSDTYIGDTTEDEHLEQTIRVLKSFRSKENGNNG